MFYIFRDGIKCGMYSKCGENSLLWVLVKKLFYNFVFLDKICFYLLFLMRCVNCCYVWLGDIFISNVL